MKTVVGTLVCALLLTVSVVQAAPISIFTVEGANTYQNTTNNPCIFFGPGGSGCNQNPAGWSTVGDTGGGDPFNPNPLVNTYGDQAGELALFAANVGRDFYLGLDVNDTSTAQLLENTTINFFNASNVNIGSYTFSPATLVPNSNNGLGYADYLLAKGCTSGGAGSGNTATCTTPTPFSAPAGTRQITFTFGLADSGTNMYNDGPDKLFLIAAGGVVTPFDPDPPGDDPGAPVPEPGSMILLGSGLFALANKARKRWGLNA